MKRRYSIIGTEHGSDHEVILAQCDSNPQAVLDGFAAMTLKVKPTIMGPGKKTKIRKFSWLRIEENV
jgi:hypothetical protein